ASLYVRGLRVRVERLREAAIPPSAFERGRALLDAGSPGEAAALFASAAASAPRSGLVRAHLALARALAGDLESAGTALDEARGLAPDSVAEAAVRALLELRRGDARAALASVDRV